MRAADCKQGNGRPFILTLTNVLIISAEAVSCLDGVSSQAVELIDGDVGLHVGKLWWRDHLQQCSVSCLLKGHTEKICMYSGRQRLVRSYCACHPCARKQHGMEAAPINLGRRSALHSKTYGDVRLAPVLQRNPACKHKGK